MTRGVFSLFLAFALALAGSPMAGQAQVRYLDLPDTARPQTLATDRSGNLFIISKVTEPSGRPQVFDLLAGPSPSGRVSFERKNNTA